MKPMHLSMTAFGPFAKTEIIEFERFGKNPLFLINGQTGSGKTTILDAMCFALYHRTTGNEREAREMRCDYAAPDDLTAITFIFELAGRRYKIHRIPEQERPKLRGKGVSKQAAKATLEAINGDSTELIVAAKVTDATREIEQLMGLKVDQFRQVMVLPQGQFRKLLIADSKDREIIFSQLFETGIYKRIEEDLSRQAKSVWIRREKLKDNQQGVLKTAGLEHAQQLEEALLSLQPGHAQAHETYLQQEQSLVAADRACRDALALQQDFDNLTELRERKASIESRADAITTLRERQQQADQARVLSPVYDELQRRSQESYQLKEHAKVTSQKLEKSAQLRTAATEEKEKNPVRLSQLDIMKSEKSQLESMRLTLDKISAIQASTAVAKQQYEKHQAQQQKLTQQHQKLVEKISRINIEKRQLEKNVADQSDLKVDIHQVQAQLKNKQTLDRVILAIAALEQKSQLENIAIEQQDKTWQRARRSAKEIELAWHQGQAVVLAQALELHQPCPVCGSENHPAPAQGEQRVPDSDERETAQLHAEQAALTLAEMKAALHDLEHDLKHQRSSQDELQQLLGVGASTTVDGLEAQLNQFLQLEQQQQREKKRLSELDDFIAKDDQASVELSNKLNLATTTTSQSAEKFHRAEASLKERQSQLPDAFLSQDQLVLAIEKNQAEIHTLATRISTTDEQFLQAEKSYQGLFSQAETVQQQFIQMQAVIKEAEMNWQTSLQHSSLASENEFLNAMLNDQQRTKLTEEIQRFDQARQETIGAINQQEKLLAQKQPPDLEKLSDTLKCATEGKSIAENEWQTLNQQLVTLQSYQSALQKFDIEQKSLEQEYAVIGTLADAANGRTGAKVSLQRFVLGVMLDEVLLQAGRRLRLMSKNRYQLYRERDRSRSRGASGLELVVEDAYSGKTRPVGTLSGGESFLASLALALGLSDVVQARSGGIRLDTLFIDEGFGSLDSESLELAIRTLIDLKNAGRMVGIISHVSELKEQLPQRLDVIKSPGGSHIHIVT